MTRIDRVSILDARSFLPLAVLPDDIRVIAEVGADADLASSSTIPTGWHVIVTTNLLSTTSSTASSFLPT